MSYSLSLKEIQDVCPDFNGQKLNIEISVLAKAIKNVMGEAADSFILKNKSDFSNIIKNTSVSTKELRDIFEEIADAEHISIDSNRLSRAYKTRSDCKELFYAVFDFCDSEDEAKPQTADAKQETAKESPKLIAKDVSTENDGDDLLLEQQKSTLTFSQAQAVLESCQFNVLNGVKLRAISMTDTMPIEVQQGFKIHIPDEVDVFKGCMLLFDGSTKEVAAIGSIVPNGKDECLVFFFMARNGWWIKYKNLPTNVTIFVQEPIAKVLPIAFPPTVRPATRPDIIRPTNMVLSSPTFAAS